MALIGPWLVMMTVLACGRPVHPIAPVPAVEGRLDATTADLDALGGQIETLDSSDCRTVAERAHNAVLPLEAGRTDANLPSIWRLHALAATAIDCSGLAGKPFFGLVDGLTVNLHDLRNAQLLRENPSLGVDGFGTVADARREHVLWLLALPVDPASADPEWILGLLREPIMR